MEIKLTDIVTVTLTPKGKEQYWVVTGHDAGDSPITMRFSELVDNFAPSEFESIEVGGPIADERLEVRLLDEAAELLFEIADSHPDITNYLPQKARILAQRCRAGALGRAGIDSRFKADLDKLADWIRTKAGLEPTAGTGESAVDVAIRLLERGKVRRVTGHGRLRALVNGEVDSIPPDLSRLLGRLLDERDVAVQLLKVAEKAEQKIADTLGLEGNVTVDRLDREVARLTGKAHDYDRWLAEVRRYGDPGDNLVELLSVLANATGFTFVGSGTPLTVVKGLDQARTLVRELERLRTEAEATEANFDPQAVRHSIQGSDDEPAFSEWSDRAHRRLDIAEAACDRTFAIVTITWPNRTIRDLRIPKAKLLELVEAVCGRRNVLDVGFAAEADFKRRLRLALNIPPTPGADLTTDDLLSIVASHAKTVEDHAVAKHHASLGEVDPASPRGYEICEALSRIIHAWGTDPHARREELLTTLVGAGWLPQVAAQKVAVRVEQPHKRDDPDRLMAAFVNPLAPMRSAAPDSFTENAITQAAAPGERLTPAELIERIASARRDSIALHRIAEILTAKPESHTPFPAAAAGHDFYVGLVREFVTLTDRLATMVADARTRGQA